MDPVEVGEADWHKEDGETDWRGEGSWESGCGRRQGLAEQGDWKPMDGGTGDKSDKKPGCTVVGEKWDCQGKETGKWSPGTERHWEWMRSPGRYSGTGSQSETEECEWVLGGGGGGRTTIEGHGRRREINQIRS